MPLTITQSNKKEYIGKDFIFNNGKDKIIIGLKIFGIGKNFEIPCKDVNEFKLLDENSKPFKTTSALKKTGGAVVGGILTGGVGAIIGADSVHNDNARLFSGLVILQPLNDSQGKVAILGFKSHFFLLVLSSINTIHQEAVN